MNNRPDHSQLMNRPDYYQSMPLRASITEIVQVPEQLGAYVGDPKFQPVLFKVKEQSHINTVTVNRSTDKIASSIYIDAPSNQSAIIARQLIEIHFKQHIKLLAQEEKLHRIENDLFVAQGEMASGHMVEFSIDPSLIGIIIGKKGARIKQIEADTGVSKILVGSDGRVKVLGNNASSVHQARELLEVVELIYPLSDLQAEWYAREYYEESLNDVKEVSGVNRIMFDRDQDLLVITGTKTRVQNAKILLDTQVEYIQKQKAIKAEADAAREKLSELKKQYGYPIRRSEGDRSDRPDRPPSGRGDRERILLPGRGRGRGEGRGEGRGDGRGGRGKSLRRESDNHGEEGGITVSPHTNPRPRGGRDRYRAELDSSDVAGLSHDEVKHLKGDMRLPYDDDDTREDTEQDSKPLISISQFKTSNHSRPERNNAPSGDSKPSRPPRKPSSREVQIVDEVAGGTGSTKVPKGTNGDHEHKEPSNNSRSSGRRTKESTESDLIAKLEELAADDSKPAAADPSNGGPIDRVTEALQKRIRKKSVSASGPKPISGGPKETVDAEPRGESSGSTRTSKRTLTLREALGKTGGETVEDA